MSPRKEEPVTVHDPELRAAIRAEVRRQLAAVGRRYLPILVGVMTLVMLVVLVPDRTSPSSAPTGSATVDAGAQEGQAGLGTTPGEASASESAVGGSRTGSPAPGGTGSASAAGTAEPGSAAGTAEEAGGTAVSGVTCGPGVRQVTWSPYSPM